MNEIRLLLVAAVGSSVALILTFGIQAVAGTDTTPDPGSVDRPPAAVTDVAPPEQATSSTTNGEQDDPDPNDLDPNDLDPNDPEVQDPELQDPEIQDPELDDSDPDDPDPAVPGPAGPAGPAGPGSDDPDDPDPDDADPDDPEVQNPELQDPEIDDPDPGGLTCPDGFTPEMIVFNAPGGQVELFVCSRPA